MEFLQTVKKFKKIEIRDVEMKIKQQILNASDHQKALPIAIALSLTKETKKTKARKAEIKKAPSF